MEGSIVCGVDGSAASLSALRWAAEESKLRGGILLAVTAWEIPVSAFVEVRGRVVPHELLHKVEERARELQAAALGEALPDDADLKVDRRLVEGAPVRVLLEAAREADLLVLGSRGLGGFKELLLGSVSQQCAHHANCPVVIIRHSVDEEGPR